MAEPRGFQKERRAFLRVRPLPEFRQVGNEKVIRADIAAESRNARHAHTAVGLVILRAEAVDFAHAALCDIQKGEKRFDGGGFTHGGSARKKESRGLAWQTVL